MGPHLIDTPELRARRLAAYQAGEYTFAPPPVCCLVLRRGPGNAADVLPRFSTSGSSHDYT